MDSPVLVQALGLGKGTGAFLEGSYEFNHQRSPSRSHACIAWLCHPKLDRITRHFDQVVDVRVLLSVEKQKEKEGRQRAECNIHVKGNDLFAECANEDLYAAVDELVDKLDRQVVRHKDRLQDHHHTSTKRDMLN